MKQTMSASKSEANQFVPTPNLFAARFGRDVRLRLHEDVVDYFAALGKDAGWTPEMMIELYLRNIAYSGYEIPLELVDFRTGSAHPAIGGLL